MSDVKNEIPKGRYLISVEIDTNDEESLQKFKRLITNNEEFAEGITFIGAWRGNFNIEKATETVKTNFLEIVKQELDNITYTDVIQK